MNRYLTKSKFKLALECSAKLFYHADKTYKNNKLDNDFLKALAKGGFQRASEYTLSERLLSPPCR